MNKPENTSKKHDERPFREVIEWDEKSNLQKVGMVCAGVIGFPAGLVVFGIMLNSVGNFVFDYVHLRVNDILDPSSVSLTKPAKDRIKELICPKFDEMKSEGYQIDITSGPSFNESWNIFSDCSIEADIEKIQYMPGDWKASDYCLLTTVDVKEILTLANSKLEQDNEAILDYLNIIGEDNPKQNICYGPKKKPIQKKKKKKKKKKKS